MGMRAAREAYKSGDGGSSSSESISVGVGDDGVEMSAAIIFAATIATVGANADANMLTVEGQAVDSTAYAPEVVGFTAALAGDISSGAELRGMVCREKSRGVANMPMVDGFAVDIDAYADVEGGDMLPESESSAVTPECCSISTKLAIKWSAPTSLASDPTASAYEHVRCCNPDTDTFSVSCPTCFSRGVGTAAGDAGGGGLRKGSRWASE
jgi:hypothetical protein